MNLQERIKILTHLGEYLTENSTNLQQVKEKAFYQNGWFVPDFIDLSLHKIAQNFLKKELLENWAEKYNLPDENKNPVKVGLTMAGNIPMVGFHDWLTLFMAGHKTVIKPSSKDDVLIRHIAEVLHGWNQEMELIIVFAERLLGCDAYIATGSNNSARYFEYYFGKYPHIIRRNRTSAAILTGSETKEELSLLADDILLYFGLGCRNVSKIYVPEGYEFEPLLNAMKKYEWMKDHDKFRNNFDYQLSLLLLNNQYYMSTGFSLMVENKELFSPISQVNYEIYKEYPQNLEEEQAENLQCLCTPSGKGFGLAQSPTLTDYADGVDTMQFALSLKK